MARAPFSKTIGAFFLSLVAALTKCDDNVEIEDTGTTGTTGCKFLSADLSPVMFRCREEEEIFTIESIAFSFSFSMLQKQKDKNAATTIKMKSLHIL